jgi:hypothetical protein
MKKMIHDCQSWFNHLSLKWMVVAALALYIGLTFTSPFSDHHVLLNLEPYPDGIFYLNAAKNIAIHGQFIVRYQAFTFHPIITPLYAYTLAVGFLFTSNPGVFYVINVVLGAVSVLMLALTIRMITPKNHILFLGILIYFSHLMLLWLPSLPMAENLVLMLFMSSLYSYFRYAKTGRWWDLVITIVLICSLVFSKYTLAGPAAVLALALLMKIRSHRSLIQFGWSLALFILAAGVFMVSQLEAGFNPLFLIWTLPSQPTTTQVAPVEEVFYSVKFVAPNMIQYARSLVGFLPDPGRFLWLYHPLTTGGLVGVFLVGLSWIAWKGKQGSFLFLLLFLSQFPILLIFYVVDQRYIILTAPLLALGLSYLVAQSKPKAKNILVMVISISLLLQFMTQLPIFRMLVAHNWLQRSVAWQYEAVKVFNTHLPSDSYLVTVLPPLFVDLYSTQQYSLLPLSPKQEFLDKKQYMWGDQVKYENLVTTYQELLEQGKSVYVTNAYLSSQHEFQAEYQNVFNVFETKEVASGCFETCNLYQLSLQK